jgi:hypothetical protein
MKLTCSKEFQVEIIRPTFRLHALPFFLISNLQKKKKKNIENVIRNFEGRILRIICDPIKEKVKGIKMNFINYITNQV